MASTASPAAGSPMQNRPAATSNAAPASVQKPPTKSTYSSKLAAADVKSRTLENAAPNAQSRPPQPPKAWQSGVNPLTQTSSTASLQASTATATSAKTSPSPSSSAFLREGQRVAITLDSGAEFEGHYSGGTDHTYTLKMVVQKKLPGGDVANGNARPSREQSNMSFQKKDVADLRVTGSLPARKDAVQNGNSPSFRTDTAISGKRQQQERELQRWVPDADDAFDGSLEPAHGGRFGGSTGRWDQFSANEELFGLRTTYDENLYTTAIDKDHPEYHQRVAAADRMAREIENSTAGYAHVAEERVKDFVGTDNGVDEEDKYSGVRRQQDFPPLGSNNRDNKYTPPAKRAPTGHSTVTGAPVDPAIISSQLARPGRATGDRVSTPKPDKSEMTDDGTPETTTPSTTSEPATADAKTPLQKPDADTAAKSETKPAATGGAVTRTASPQIKSTDNLPKGTPNATATVERDVSKAFKTFALQQRQSVQRIRNKAKEDKEVRLNDLKNFAVNFKLNTPVPKDLVSIIAKDPAKQREIQEKAKRNADAAQIAKQETEKKPAASAPTSTEGKPAPPAPATPQAAAAASARPATRAPSNTPQGPYNPALRPAHQPPAGQARPQQNLNQRLQNKGGQMQVPGHFVTGPDGRPPPTGPAHGDFSRRSSGVGVNAKLNPNSNEFKPSPFAQVFNPNSSNRSSASSPRSSVTGAPSAPTASPIPTLSGSLLRRKPATDGESKAKEEPSIMKHLQSIEPVSDKKWTDNGSFKPAYDTALIWGDHTESELSTMMQTYKQVFEQSFASHAMPSPLPGHMNPQAHQHQLPFHMQQAHMNRQSPRQPALHMNGSHHGHGPSPSFGGHDDHRMMPSHSAQSYASPRLQPVNMAYPSPMAQSAQLAYNQMQYPMGPAGQMAQYRSYSGGHQFVPQQSPMAGPVMIQGPPGSFMGPQGMVAPGPQMSFIPGQGHFVPPGAPPPPVLPGTNGYPSPGRSAPMMVSQGSQQGQPMYGMSPAMQYGQPIYAQQPGQMPNMRGYPPQGQQHFGTSPQQMHQYPQHRGPGNFNKNFQSPHGQPNPPAQQTPAPTGPARTEAATEEAK